MNPAALIISGGIFSHDLSTGADYLDSTYAMGIQNAFAAYRADAT